MLRTAILAASRRPAVKRLVAGAPVSRSVVRRFVAGEAAEDAVATVRRLAAAGLDASLDHLGEDTLDLAQADATVQAYLDVLVRLSDAGLTQGGRCEVSVKLTAVGGAVEADRALDNARRVCAAADAVGTTVTLDMEDSSTTDATLSAVHALRVDFPGTGAVVQAYLRRTEQDCRDLAVAGSRVRLCKGAYREPPAVAFQDAAEVSAAYRRCLAVLMAGAGYPMVATHDPALVAAARALGRDREAGFELQMLLGVRPDEQERLATDGERVRVYVPYGEEWYGYLMRRLAERPANAAFFLRALASRS